MKQWYEELFTDYARAYDKESFTQGTIQEVDFIESETGSDKSRTILDIGCGTGRHAIELATRGYTVTGIDLSDSQLQRAREKAKSANVQVTFLKRDARDFQFDSSFDLVIMLCEGGFPLMETDEMNYQILENAEKALRKNGKFIFTTLNGLFPLYHSVKDFINANAQENLKSGQNTFDLMTFRDISDITVTDDSGTEKRLHCNERYYVPCEITWLLKSLHFRNTRIYGCEVGNFHREKPLTTGDYEMLVIAEK
jgi:2-polyprenyl-3-methyl-5-hydroxy-6-metoxy-1,4-benzoquinol methylase